MENKKLNISFIKELIHLEIKDYYEKISARKELKSNISILKEMIKILETDDYEQMKENFILFDSIIPLIFNTAPESTKNMLNNLYNSINRCNNYIQMPNKYLKEDFAKGKKYINNLTTKLQIVLNQLEAKLVFTKPSITEEKKNIYQNIINSLKLSKEISSFDYKILLELFKSKDLSEKEIIILLESIKNHNIKIHYTNNNIDYNKLNEISNILSLGFEEFEDISWIEDTRKKQLDSLIDTIIHQQIDEYIIPELLPRYNGNLTFSENYSLANIKYFYITLLKLYQNEILNIHDEINNLDNYLNKKDRKTLVVLYKETIKNYLFIRKKMDTEIKKYNVDINKIKEQEEDVRTLDFALKSSGTSFIESDLKDIPKDTYDSVRELLMLFRKGKLSSNQIKSLAFPGIYEIKDDQIRILYTHVKDNEYVALGAFIKKEDNPTKQYKIQCNRDFTELINSLEIEEEIFSKLEHHSGGRRKS